jgi:hypothetical protein
MRDIAADSLGAALFTAAYLWSVAGVCFAAMLLVSKILG